MKNKPSEIFEGEDSSLKKAYDEAVPNPGSEEAVKAGCRCPVIDNHYGKGTPYGFWMSEDCPLHGYKTTKI